MENSFMKRSFALILAIILITAFITPKFLYAENRAAVFDKASAAAAPAVRENYFSIDKIQHGIFPVRSENIAPSDIKPATLERVNYKLKKDVEVIPSDVTLKSIDGKTRVYDTNAVGFKFVKGRTYVDKKTKAAFKVQDVKNLTRVDSWILTNGVQLDEILEDFEIPAQDVYLNSANIDPSTVNPYVTVNHGAKPDLKKLEQLKMELPKAKDLNPQISVDPVKSGPTTDIKIIKNIDTLEIPQPDGTQTKVMSGTLPGGLSGDGVSVHQEGGYVEVEFKDLNLGQFVDKSQLNAYDGHVTVEGKLNGKVGLYAPTIYPYYKFGKKLGAKFIAGEVIDLQIDGVMQFDGNFRIPIYGFDIGVADVGNICAGVFLRISFNGEASIEFDMDQSYKYMAGAEVGFKWLVIPTGVKTFSDFDKKLKVQYTLDMKAAYAAAVGPEVSLQLFGFDLLNLHVYIGAAGDAKIHLSNVPGGTDQVYITINGYADVGGAIVGKRFNIYKGQWFIEEKTKPYTGRFEITILDTDSYRDHVRGTMTYKPSGSSEYSNYNGRIGIVVINGNNQEKSYPADCKNGTFTADNVKMYKGDRVSIHVTDSSNGEEIKSKPVPCKVHFKEIVITKGDFFNDVVEGYIPSYMDGDQEIKYDGLIDISIKRNETIPCVPAPQIEGVSSNQAFQTGNSTVVGAPFLIKGEGFGLLPYIDGDLFKDNMKDGKFLFAKDIRGNDEIFAKVNINGFEIYDSEKAASYEPLKINARYTLKGDVIHKGISNEIDKFVVTAEIKGVIENVNGTKAYTGKVHLWTGDFLSTNGIRLIDDDVKVTTSGRTNYSTFEITKTKEYVNDGSFPLITEEAATYMYDKLPTIKYPNASVNFDVEGYDFSDDYWFLGNPIDEMVEKTLKDIRNTYVIHEKDGTFDIENPLVNPLTEGDLKSKLVWGLENIAAGKAIDITGGSIANVKSLKLRNNTGNSNYSVDVVVKSGGNTVTNKVQVKGNVIKSESAAAGGKIIFQNDLTQDYMTLSNAAGNTKVKVSKTEQPVLTPLKVTAMKDATIDRKLCSVYMYEFEEGKVEVAMWKEKGLPLKVKGYDASGSLQYEVSYNNYKF